MPQNDSEQADHGVAGLRNLLERITPWLFAVGSWIFGGLIAFNLVVVSSLLTIRPVDTAILISITALACALPLDLVGIFLLRLMTDMKDIGIDDLALKAFQDAGVPDIEAYLPAPEETESLYRRRSSVTLGYSLGILVLSVALTLTGLVAALWHTASWIGMVLLLMVIFCAVLVIVVMAHSLPPESEAERKLKRRYIESRNRQNEMRRKAEQDQ